jgi:predicted RNase H-like nuclease (RuvC/YqgF family)
MTEEIIIDGVNVAGCDFFAKEDFYNSYSGETQAYKGECGCSDDEMCKDIKNCCYKKQGKQLKKLEQERDELKQENERLQSEIRQKKMTIMMNNDHYLTVDENNRKYCSVLEEIRRIIVINKDEFDYCLHHDYDEQILNKINEVLK